MVATKNTNIFWFFIINMSYILKNGIILDMYKRIFLTAVGIVFAILTMTQAVGSMIGIGAGNLISESLGANDNKNASNIASVAFFLSIIFGIIVTTLGIIFKEELMNILGATKTILPLAKEFAHYILIASPIICCSYVLNILLRSQGKPKSSMIGLSIGAIVNIILEPIFIFKLKTIHVKNN